MLTRSRRQLPRHRANTFNIQDKANRILYIILIGIALILIRVWHLSVIQHEAKVEEALKPRHRVIMEPAKRATIRDRFDIPLAINKVQYQATILYSQFKEIPSFSWETDDNGKKVKRPKRKEYIARLARLLGQELHLDGDRIEDLIYSKAAFYGNVPFVLKEDINEKEYYRLKMMEKDWPGIHVRKMSKRYYPNGRLASDIIGYMGAINRHEYENIIHEIKNLETYLKEQNDGEDPELPAGLDSTAHVQQRLQELEERAYSITDYVGKTGIEGKFEEQLRGFQGKKIYYADARGNFLKEMPGSRPPLAGDRLHLTISAELQEFAEQLLIQSETLRHHQQYPDGSIHAPWIRGGAIVAMDPNTGEILALASYPRFDPNDFISSGNPDTNREKRSHILRWFENEAYIAELWDQKRPLEREIFDPKVNTPTEDTLWLGWERYLDLILPHNHPVRKGLARIATVQAAIDMQNTWESLVALSQQEEARALINFLYRTEPHLPARYTTPYSVKERLEANLRSKETTALKQRLDRYFFEIDNNYDKLLLLDLCRVAVCSDRFSPQLLEHVGQQTLSEYRNASASFVSVQEVVKDIAKDLFRDTHFKAWRKENEKKFLRQKRLVEKTQHKYPKPYLDYLDTVEQEMFQEFWSLNRWALITAFLSGSTASDTPEELDPYLAPLLSWHDELLSGAHQALPWRKPYLTLQQILTYIDPEVSTPYLESMRGYQDLNRPLLGRYRHLRSGSAAPLEKHLAAAFYPLYGYGYGRSQAYRQATTQGSIFKVVTAYEALLQRYDSLKKRNPSFKELNPLEIIDRYQPPGNTGSVASAIDGTPIPRMYKGGRIPKSLSTDIGKVDVVGALKRSSNPYFAMLTVDAYSKPDDLADAAKLFSYGQKTGIDLPAEIPGRVPTDLMKNRTGLYALAIGQHSLVVTPLQTAVMLSAIANGGQILKPQIISSITRENQEIKTLPFVKREAPLPQPIRNVILEGMHSVITHIQEDGMRGLEKVYRAYPEALKSFSGLKDQVVGKSSSAEYMEAISLDQTDGIQKINHIWFSGIAFDHNVPTLPLQASLSQDHYGKPEIVVVVYLKHGNYGKEAAPIATQMIQKWREIKRGFAP